MRYLITGGAGFVGSHLVLTLLDAGHEAVIIDNFSTGHRGAVPSGTTLHQIDLNDAQATSEIIADGPWDGVFHFAALSLVGESMRAPMKYFQQNFVTAFNVINACITHNVKKVVFSSTAALFGGDDRHAPIAETAICSPGSPYGESKLMIERVLHWADHVHGLRSACLRYFNAAGADELGRAGEDHRPETHLIPLAIDALLGRRPALQLYGDKYPTPDGTCIRDYIHVSDLARAHVAALEQIEHCSASYNLGIGCGYSNKEVIESVQRVGGRNLPWELAPARAGDPPILVAEASKFRRQTGWAPRFDHIDKIVATAFAWREKHPNGYKT